MKLVTWNCNMAFRKKQQHILHYNPDILVIQECENPANKGQWTEFTSWVWIGDNEHKGLGVFARNGYHVTQMANVSPNAGRYVLPVKISGHAELDLITVWAMDDKEDSKKRYIGQVYTALKAYEDLLGARSVVLGDFNWNVIWDVSTSRLLYGNFCDTAEILSRRGLRSVYHAYRNCSYGHETEPTLYLLKKRSRPYHIDYIFIPDNWFNRVSNFWVGAHDDWIKHSDHMPLMVELNDFKLTQ